MDIMAQETTIHISVLDAAAVSTETYVLHEITHKFNILLFVSLLNMVSDEDVARRLKI